MNIRRPICDLFPGDSTTLGNKPSRSSGGNIKDKISLWENKDSTLSHLTSSSLSKCASIKGTDSLKNGSNKTVDEQSTGCARTAAIKKKDLGKENVVKHSDSRSPDELLMQPRMASSTRSSDSLEKTASKRNIGHKETPQDDSRPCSPHVPGNQPLVKNPGSRSSDNHTKIDCKKIVGHKETPSVDSGPCSPPSTEKKQMGMLRNSSEKKSLEQTSMEKRAVFTLFKKLETLEESHGKAPAELGNYFSPPAKDKIVEVKKTELNDSAESRSVWATEDKEDQDNVYTEPGALPINPVPKPKRTFQHPQTASMGGSSREGRGKRNLPPLPSSSSKASSKPPCGYYGRPRADRYLNERYKWFATKCVTHIISCLLNIEWNQLQSSK